MIEFVALKFLKRFNLLEFLIFLNKALAIMTLQIIGPITEPGTIPQSNRDEVTLFLSTVLALNHLRRKGSQISGTTKCFIIASCGIL